MTVNLLRTDLCVIMPLPGKEDAHVGIAPYKFDSIIVMGSLR